MKLGLPVALADAEDADRVGVWGERGKGVFTAACQT